MGTSPAQLQPPKSVVSVKIDAVENSLVGDMLYYYEKQTPEEIAGAIKSIDINSEYDSRKRITKLDRQFKKEILEVIR